MGIGTRIALFVGIPAIIIIAVGFALRMFQPTIFSSASAIGETLAGIFTRPVTGFIGSISGAFADLPDIVIDVPGLVIGGGGVTFGDGNGELVAPPPGEVPFMGGTITTPPGCFINANGQIECPTPPIFTPPPPPSNGGLIPPAEASELTPREGSLAVDISGQGLTSLPISEIIGLTPGVLGLFDILGTEQVEFLPLSLEAIQFFQESGQELRLSGQLFEEIKNIGDIDF